MKHSYVLIVAAYLIACEKPEQDVQNVKTDISHIQKTEITPNDMAPTNPRNHYDYYGALHNEGMNYVRTKMQEAGETRQEDVTKYVQQFAAFKTGKTINNDYGWLYQQLMKDSVNFYSALIVKANLSPAGKEYLQSIFGVITKRASANQFIYDNVKAEILEIENRILVDSLLPAYDYKELLKACSLARYSSYYWSLQPPKTKSIFKGILSCIVGICADLSALEPLCGSFLNWMSGGDFDPIAISSIMYYSL